ncbi:disintegrin and metalloproteinase domain-containing protein 15 [Spea bombifrons]|uniref:disintegrin and metalloproteinase domain-containing protein 15 n=1 Tax=Spea bombifrons TaxID=233779 RepID=UPI00234B258D|nr:disintegrin and metalloproteinase domain-containing protein 15 [Spea bombifrons]
MRFVASQLFLLLWGLIRAEAPHSGEHQGQVRGTGAAADPWTPHWDVFPDLRQDGRRLRLQEAAQSMPSQLHLSIDVEGRRIHMELQRNRYLVPESHSLAYYLPDGTRVTDNNPQPTHCLYHGRLTGQAGPWSSLSLCAGIRGAIIVSADRRYTIEPVPGDGSHRHILRMVMDQLPQNMTCGTRETPHERSRRELPRLPPHGTGVLNETKYVEMVMVADSREYKLYDKDLKRLHMRILEIANKVDAFYRVLNVRVVLLSVEVWTQEDKIAVSTDPAETLIRFLSWREKSLLPLIQHDNAQLLTGVTFKNSSVGMATMNSICTDDLSGGVNMDHSVSILGVASTVAHELGHNLGLNHDTSDRACGQPEKGKHWIMQSSSGFMPGLEFSNCSVMDLMGSLRQGRGACLFNAPSPPSVFGKARCGNSLVEEGEQCDCGLTQECADPCCNASTCQLAAGAECSSDGLCCQWCKLKPPGSLCRDRLGDCDLPEYCTGVSQHCPPNVFVQNGEPCDGGRAYCYLGECRSLESQCQSLWGPGSSPAPESCFSKVNVRGDKYGHCGQGPNGTFRPCADRDVRCGKIQCQGGRDRPIVGSSARVSLVSFSVNGTELQCRGTYYNLGDDIWDPTLVMTGTVCGEGKVCLGHRCQDVSALKPQSCESKCSNHGICNSNNNCHCDPGWAPPVCGSVGLGGSIDSGPLALERAGRSLTTSLLLVFLLFAPLLILCGVCFLKRQALQRRLGSLSKGSRCRYRVTQTSSQSLPQRPPPPQWTQGAELQVMSTNHQGSERPDPPTKPLPPDPVHKRCQASVLDRPPPPTRPLPADPLPRQAQVTRPRVEGSLW